MHGYLNVKLKTKITRMYALWARKLFMRQQHISYIKILMNASAGSSSRAV